MHVINALLALAMIGLVSADGKTTVPMVSGPYSFLGCYAEPSGLSGIASGTGAQSVDQCATYCQTNGNNNYFFVEYYGQCQCGNTLSPVPAATTGCTYPCNSNASQICGGSSVFDLYELTANIAAAPAGSGSTSSASSKTSTSSTSSSTAAIAASGTTVPMVSGPYSFIGCYGEPSGLSGIASGTGAQSVDQCAAFCQTNGNNNYFFVEYYGQCQCGNVLSPAPAPATGCTYPCNSNASQICGGSSVFDLYELTANIPSSAPAGSGSTSSMSSSSSASSTPSTSSTSSKTSTSSTSSSTSAAVAASGTTVPMVAGSYSFLGCYGEPSGLSGIASGTGAQSVDLCATFCQTNGNNNYFFVEYYGQCQCGNTLSPAPAPATGCTYPCNSNASQICGGSSVFDLYELTANIASSPAGVSTSSTSSTSSTPSTSSTASTSSKTSTSTGSSSSSSSTSAAAAASGTTVPMVSGLYSFTGCYGEPSGLSGISSGTGAQSVDLCAAFCSANGVVYNYFFVEYYGQCQCGNTLSPAPAPATGCTYACNSNASQICGGSSVFDLYELTANIAAAPAGSGFTSSSSSTSSKPSTSSSSSTLSTSSTSSKTSTSSSSSSTSTAAVAAASGTTVPMVSGPYSFIGCYGEPSGLSGISSGTGAQSVDLCAAFCSTNGVTYNYFFVEYYGQCQCGNTLSPAPAPATGCTYACHSNASQICGGSSVFDLYELTANIAPAPSGAGSTFSTSSTSFTSSTSSGPSSSSSTLSSSSTSSTSSTFPTSRSTSSSTGTLSSTGILSTSIPNTDPVASRSSRSVAVSASKASASVAAVSRSSAASVSRSSALLSKASVNSVHSASIASARSSRSSYAAVIASSKSSASSSRSSARAAVSASKASVSSARAATAIRTTTTITAHACRDRPHDV